MLKEELSLKLIINRKIYKFHLNKMSLETITIPKIEYERLKVQADIDIDLKQIMDVN